MKILLNYDGAILLPATKIPGCIVQKYIGKMKLTSFEVYQVPGGVYILDLIIYPKPDEALISYYFGYIKKYFKLTEITVISPQPLTIFQKNLLLTVPGITRTELVADYAACRFRTYFPSRSFHLITVESRSVCIYSSYQYVGKRLSLNMELATAITEATGLPLDDIPNALVRASFLDTYVHFSCSYEYAKPILGNSCYYDFDHERIVVMPEAVRQNIYTLTGYIQYALKLTELSTVVISAMPNGILLAKAIGQLLSGEKHFVVPNLNQTMDEYIPRYLMTEDIRVNGVRCAFPACASFIGTKSDKIYISNAGLNYLVQNPDKLHANERGELLANGIPMKLSQYNPESLNLYEEQLRQIFTPKHQPFKFVAQTESTIYAVKKSILFVQKFYEDKTKVFSKQMNSIISYIYTVYCATHDDVTLFDAPIECVDKYTVYPAIYCGAFCFVFVVFDIENTVFEYENSPRHYIYFIKQFNIRDEAICYVSEVSFSLQQYVRFFDYIILLKQIIHILMNYKRFAPANISLQSIRVTYYFELVFDQFLLRPGPVEMGVASVSKVAFQMVKGRLTLYMLRSQKILQHNDYLWKIFVSNSEETSSYDYIVYNSPLFMNSDYKSRVVEKIWKNIYESSSTYNKYLVVNDFDMDSAYNNLKDLIFRTNTFTCSIKDNSFFGLMYLFRNIVAHFTDGVSCYSGTYNSIGEFFEFYESQANGMFYTLYDIFLNKETK